MRDALHRAGRIPARSKKDGVLLALGFVCLDEEQVALHELLDGLMLEGSRSLASSA